LLTLLKAGIYTTVQDAGRFSGAHLGIPISGPMDGQSARLANLILENEENDALLECTFVAPTLEFQKPTLIAIKGASTTAYINNQIIDISTAIPIKAGDVLSFGKMEKGCRCYITIKGGIQSEVIYGSRSTCITAGILKPLKKGDHLDYHPYIDEPKTSITLNRVLGNTTFTVTKGPEFSILNTKQKRALFSEKFSVLPSSNRMAYRVQHSIDLTHNHSILSSGTMPGTVQLTPYGGLVFLMRDCQTTGGYPRIFQLTEESICDLAQLSPNEKFSIQLI